MTSFVGPSTELFDNTGLPIDHGKFVSSVKIDGKETIVFNSSSQNVGGFIEIKGDYDAVVYTSQESQVDFITTGDGDDRIHSGGKSDEIFSGAGNDIVRGGSGDDNIFGGTGDDQLIGGDGSDLIEGGDGDDIIWGAAGDDIIRGGKGADVLSGGLGSDTFIIKGDDLTFDDQGNVDVVDAIVDFNDNEDVFVLQDMQVNGVVSYDSGTGDVTLTDSADPDVSRVIAKLQPGLDITVIDQGEGDWTLL